MCCAAATEQAYRRQHRIYELTASCHIYSASCCILGCACCRDKDKDSKKKKSKSAEGEAAENGVDKNDEADAAEAEAEESEEEEEVVWMTDTSAAAVAARAAEQLTAATAALVTQGNIEAEKAEAKKRAKAEAKKKVSGASLAALLRNSMSTQSCPRTRLPVKCGGSLGQQSLRVDTSVWVCQLGVVFFSSPIKTLAQPYCA